MEYKILLCHLFDDANNMKGMHEILELALAICPCSRTILSISWPVGYWRNDVLKMGPMWRTLCFLAVNKSLFPIITYQSKKVTLPISGLNGLHFRHLIISISKAKSWDGGPPLWRVFSYSPWESNFRGHFRAEGQRKISFWGWCQSIFMASRPFLFYSLFSTAAQGWTWRASQKAADKLFPALKIAIYDRAQVHTLYHYSKTELVSLEFRFGQDLAKYV